MRNRVLGLAAGVLVSCGMVGVAGATNFAVLLGNGKTECVVDVGFKGDGIGVQGLKLVFPESVVSSPVKVEIETSPVLPKETPGLAGVSYQFSLRLSDVGTGDAITQFADAVTVCFVGLSTGVADGALCLGYLDEKGSPPKWVCQDAALKRDKDNYLCGTTTHFTIFTLAETASVPEPGVMGVLGLGGVLLLRRR